MTQRATWSMRLQLAQVIVVRAMRKLQTDRDMRECTNAACMHHCRTLGTTDRSAAARVRLAIASRDAAERTARRHVTRSAVPCTDMSDLLTARPTFTRPPCPAAAAAINLLPAPELSSKPAPAAAAAVDRRDRQTDGPTDTRPFLDVCAYYAS